MDNDLERPLVSICCITYNHANFIHQALDGFLMQETSFPFEIIVHDDASTDGTTDVIKKYASQYPHLIRPIYQVENQYSKEIKISPMYVWPRARGKYIALCEGDDYWTDPHKLQMQVGFLEEHPDHILCHHDATIVNENGARIKDSKLGSENKRDFSAEELIKGAWVLTLTACFRNIIRECPPEYYKVKNGDTFLFSLLGNFGKSKYLGDNITPAVYRIHQGGTWSGMQDHWLRIMRALNTYYWLRRYYYRLGLSKYAQSWSHNLPYVEILYKLPGDKKVACKVAEGFQKLDVFLAGLKYDQEDIASIRACLAANLHIGACIAYLRWRSSQRAWSHLRQAIELDPITWGDVASLESMFVNQGIALAVAGGKFNPSILRDYTESLRLDPQRSHQLPGGLMRRVRGRLYTEAAYNGYLNSDPKSVRINTWHALQANPFLIKDLGMLRRVLG